jgi:hypothetical protein
MGKKRHSHCITGVGLGSMLDSLTSGHFEEVIFDIYPQGRVPVKITELSNHANRDRHLEFKAEVRVENRRRQVAGVYDWAHRTGEIYLTDKLAQHFTGDIPVDVPDEDLD